MIDDPEYTVSVLAFNRRAMTERCLQSVLANSPPATEVIVTDNASTDGTVDLIRDLAGKDTRVRVITKATNEGVGGPKREACESARAPLFVSLDNDAWVGPGWLDALRTPLDRDSQVMQVGLEGRHQTLCDNGDGRPGGPLEYIDGSCFMVRTGTANALGLCDRYFPFAYGDDSDFSLRLQARGYRIATTPAPVQHLDGEHEKADHGGVNLREHHARNRDRFARRWKDYLRRRAFDPTIAIRRSDAMGDVVIASALPRRLKAIWPQGRIFFATKLPAVLDGNPYIEQVIPSGEYNLLAPRMAYAWDLDRAYERNLGQNYWRSYAEATVLSGDESAPGPDLHVSQEARAAATAMLGAYERLAILGPGLTGWAGKDIDPALWIPAVQLLRRHGYVVAEIGLGPPRLEGAVDLVLTGQTSFPMLAAVMEGASLYLGVDSGPYHVAEAMHVPAIVFFGCTLPELVSTHRDVTPIQATGLDCLGCHHGRPPRTTSFQGCARGDLACRGIDPQAVVRAVERHLSRAEMAA